MPSTPRWRSAPNCGGPLDPSLLGDLDRLGEYHTLMRTYESAEAAYRHALVIRETLYGKLHPDLIASVDGLAYALFGQQKYDEAEPVYQRLLELWEASVGKDHAMVAVALDKVASFYAAQKKYAEVRALLERSTAIRARFLAMGISQQATEAFTEEQLEQVKAFYRRGIAVLDPPSPVHDDLREQFEGMLKAMEKPLPKSAPVKTPVRCRPSRRPSSQNQRSQLAVFRLYLCREAITLRAISSSAVALGISSTARCTSGSVRENMASLSSTLNAAVYISFARLRLIQSWCLANSSSVNAVPLAAQIALQLAQHRIVRHPALGQRGACLPK